ncbi:glycoside hydrolase [Cochleicola gelatinilyticus]|uniref:Glycoside hydrolase n=1 Tax=Cochleicola gelatinilyticus TaxID=1763537 RepID=A0A167JF71_9FLAO|nr:glycoside hydrolase [Cochleicola gelatinilyticus]
MNGVSFVASRNTVIQEHIDPLIQLHANYAAVMPFGFIRNIETPEILHNNDRQWFGETRSGVKQYVEMLHKNNIRVMIKPQLWLWHGEYTGFLKMTSEKNWTTLEASYRSFILEYAEAASELGVEIFCIGTELEQFVSQRPEYWSQLISEIKTVYSGKLTYAANWDEYKRVPFWKELDYIGVDAYFPVSENKTPTVESVRKGWAPWKQELENIARQENRKILFTEFGYRSVDFSGKEPWKSDRHEQVANMVAQNNTTQGLFEEFWSEDWFAGGFIWKWFIDHSKSGGPKNNQFTPQNKPVENLIRNHYKNHRE